MTRRRFSGSGRRLTAVAGSALLVAALGAPVAAQDIQTDGWGDIGDVTIRVAA
ncbi:MAG: hypothetical protein ACC726_06090 [Chloroflexota bacterium]